MILGGTGVFFSSGSVEIFLGFKCFLVERQVVKYEVIACPKAAAYWKSFGKGMASSSFQSCPLSRELWGAPRTGVQEAAGFACWAWFTDRAFWRSLGMNRAWIKGLIPLQKEEKVEKNNAGVCLSTWSSSLSLFWVLSQHTDPKIHQLTAEMKGWKRKKLWNLFLVKVGL